MENTKFHGRGTDMTKAVKHAQSILDVSHLTLSLPPYTGYTFSLFWLFFQSSTRQGLEGIRRVFAVITNGYSDAKLTTDQDVVEAVFTLADNVDTVFVAREDSSVSNQRGTHTNTELWIQIFFLFRLYNIIYITSIGWISNGTSGHLMFIWY